MEHDLFDYQREAAVGVLRNLRLGGEAWADHGMLSSFALSAVTGAGKTVIATAVIEAMLHGSADLDTEADPRATFLWVTDDPALNRQTRNRMMEASDLLHPNRLVILDNDYLDSALRPGRVYFLNIQKLGKGSGLSQGGVNLRQHSMWDIIANTVDGGTTDLYLVLDEAHRGMKRSSDRTTIVHRIISGEKGSNPPVPVVWGISATIDRFTKAMEGVTNRTSYPFVEVDIDKVRASGLIKDEIGVDEPAEKGTFTTTLLRDAVASTLDYESRWAKYAEDENDQHVVLPVLVVQVPDKVSDADLTETVGTIEQEWPGLGPDAVVHVFGEHEPLFLGGRTVKWVHPESIQGDDDIRVVLAKQAISTGWDCPRAEVLFSERPATDATHIAQIIGRMVRQPLRQRILTDDVLNSVACYLPKFDKTTLDSIKAELEGKGKANGDNRLGADVLRAPKVYGRSPDVDNDVFDLIESLPSVPAPDVLASPLRRAKQLVKLLTDDAAGKAMLADAGDQLTKALNKRLDGLAAERSDDVDAKVEDLETLKVKQSTLTPTGEDAGTRERVSPTHVQDLDRDTWKVVRSVKEGVGKEYLAHRLTKAGSSADKREVRVDVAALFLVDGVLDELDAAATKWVQDRLAEFAVEIKNTSGSTRDQFLKVQEQASKPERVGIEMRSNVKAATKAAKGADIPTFDGHVYVDDAGKFPVTLNDWETRVVETEIARPSFVAWYRNPSRATPAALRIAYQDEARKWTSLQPDFVVVSKKGDGSLGVSIVDPHGDHLADAKAKLRTLAQYAEDYGDEFVRIESVAEASNGDLMVLDMHDPAVRDAVRAFEGGKVSALYESVVARPYK